MSAVRAATPPQVLVVGNSRSGTTMMSRVLGLHSRVFTFEELHFFEQLWQPSLPAETIDREEASRLARRLFATQRQGYHHHGGGSDFAVDAERLLDSIEPPLSAPGVYGAFLAAEAASNGATVACDQTPRNLYYLSEILELFSDARAVIMIRDPRDVLLSQKNRWKRRQLSGGRRTTRRNAVRTWAGYNPITISLLWRSGARSAQRWQDDPRAVVVRFEDLLAEPEAETRRICEHLGIEFEPAMLAVPRVGSSHRPDEPETMGIDPNAAGRWRRDLSPTEVWISQRINGPAMSRYGYSLDALRPDPFRVAGAAAALVAKAALAFALNAGRTRNVIESARRRIAG